MVSLTQTIPAMPVRDAPTAVGFYRDRLGFVSETDFGALEFATLDQDGNLVAFFQWVER